MIRLIEARNFRMLAANRVHLDRFHMLVGQNSTGKTTFLDALQLLADILAHDVPTAVRMRAPGFDDLCFYLDEPIELAVEVSIPDDDETPDHTESRFRYEIEFGPGAESSLQVLRENLFRMPARSERRGQQSLFGGDTVQPLIHKRTPKGWRKVVSKTAEGKDYFQDERTKWNNVFRFGPERAALGSIPEDPDRFSLSIRVRDLLRGVRMLALDARVLRKPSPPGGKLRLGLDGSDMPFVIRDLWQRDRFQFDQWVQHVATGVGGLEDVDIWERPEDRHLVLRAHFAGAHADPVPSWLLSDGTLRMMALSLLSYAAVPDATGVYLIEEPENGLHPLAVQTVYEALSTPPDGVQMLCASHSPVMLSHAKLDQVLVFRRTPEGSAIVRHGREVPELVDWADRNNLADLFAAGVLA